MSTAKQAGGSKLPLSPLPDVSLGGVDALDRLHHAGQVLGVSAEALDRAWGQAAALGLPPSDPTVLFLIVCGRLDDLTTKLPSRIKAAAADAADGLQAAARSHAAAAAESLAAARSRAAADTSRAVETAIASRLTAANRWSSALIALVAVAALAAGGVTGWSTGKSSGRAEVASAAATLSTIASRPDAPILAHLIEANDFSAIWERWCSAGQQIYRDGGWQCTMTIWTSPRPVPPASSRSSGDIIGTILDKLAGLIH